MVGSWLNPASEETDVRLSILLYFSGFWILKTLLYDADGHCLRVVINIYIS
jgi:hypothetical protein